MHNIKTVLLLSTTTDLFLLLIILSFRFGFVLSLLLLFPWCRFPRPFLFKICYVVAHLLFRMPGCQSSGSSFASYGLDTCGLVILASARLPNFVHQKTALVLTSVKNEDKLEFSKILDAIKANFNDKIDEDRRKWGGGFMGSKFQGRQNAKDLVSGPFMFISADVLYCYCCPPTLFCCHYLMVPLIRFLAPIRSTISTTSACHLVRYRCCWFILPLFCCWLCRFAAGFAFCCFPLLG